MQNAAKPARARPGTEAVRRPAPFTASGPGAARPVSAAPASRHGCQPPDRTPGPSWSPPGWLARAVKQNHLSTISALEQELENARVRKQADSAAFPITHDAVQGKSVAGRRLGRLQPEEESSSAAADLGHGKVRRINMCYAAKQTKDGARDGFLGTFGDQTDFFAGLEAFNGRPMVADDAALFEKMRDEFVLCTDSRVRNIYASNYDISTNVRCPSPRLPSKRPFPAPVHPNALTFARGSL